MNDEEVRVETTLVQGFRFSCRSDCALCCYTTPFVTTAELAQIRTRAPHLMLTSLASDRSAIASFPGGGACRMLTERRCSIHSVRPGPCQMFPVTLHGGPERWQASLVLSCPGIPLDALAGWRHGGNAAPPEGLDPELEVAERRAGLPSAVAAHASAARHRRRALRALGLDGAQFTFEALRAELRPSPDLGVTAKDLPGEVPPSLDEGAEYLPLTWEGPGQVSLMEGHPLGLRFIAITPSGAQGGPSELFPTPRVVPPMTPVAQALLVGYLHYWLERDVLIDYLLAQALEEGGRDTMVDRTRRELGFIGATVIARATVRARRQGNLDRSLGRDAIEQGIRATDMDLLDRPGLGAHL